MKKWIVLGLLSVVALTGCKSETQNQLRRQVLDYANTRMYISLYSLDGKEVYKGPVDGKVTRADNADGGIGEYVYWFDDKGRYHQTNLPYLLTSYDRNAVQP